MSTRDVFTEGSGMCTDITLKYLQTSNAAYAAAKGRFGTKAVQVGGAGGYARVGFANNPATGFCNFAVQVTAFPTSGTNKIWEARDQNLNAVQCSLAFLPSGQLQAYRGDTVTAIGSPSSQVFAINTIIQLEIKVTINSTTGLFQVRLNGNATPIINFSGNTQTSANAYLSAMALANGSSGINTYFSDIVMFDSGGSAPNDFIGNKRVYTLLPNMDSATGGLNQFSTQPSQSSGNHFLNVNAAAPPGDSTYNFDSTVNDRESYRMPSLPANASGVVGINVWASWRIDDAGPHTAEISSRSATTDSFSAAINVAASYAYSSFFQATDPATSVAWTPSAVGGSSGSEIGVKVIS